MRRNITILTLLLLIHFNSLFAYDYQTVYSHRTALFANSSKSVIGFKIDSVKIIGDSIFFPFKNIQQAGENCFNPHGSSWLGDKIIVNERWNYFFNENNDTIKIKTDAKLQETWTVFQLAHLTVSATVEKIDTSYIGGIIDTVKTVVFHVLDIRMNPLINFLEGKKIKLSKNYGFVSVYNFVDFPDYYSILNRSIDSEIYTLVGLSHPAIGLQNLTWFDVFDFQVGDEIHTKYNCLQTTAGPHTRITRNIIQKYLNRINYSDSIVYQIEQISEVKQYSNNILITEQFDKSIVNSVIKKDSLFDKLPS